MNIDQPILNGILFNVFHIPMTKDAPLISQNAFSEKRSQPH